MYTVQYISTPFVNSTGALRCTSVNHSVLKCVSITEKCNAINGPPVAQICLTVYVSVKITLCGISVQVYCIVLLYTLHSVF